MIRWISSKILNLPRNLRLHLSQNLKHLRQIQNLIKQKNLVDRDQLIDLVHALDHQIKIRKVNQIKKEKDRQSNRQRKGSQDPIKLANRYENLEDMELEIDFSDK